MKILNSKLRIFILMFALVALGGATTGMFFAASQNKSVLASETDDALIAVDINCSKNQDRVNGGCLPKCAADEFRNKSTHVCEKITKDIPVKSVSFTSKVEDISDTITRDKLFTYTIDVPDYSYEPAEATDAKFAWKSSNEQVVEVIEENGETSFKTVGFGKAILTLSLVSDDSISASFVVELTQDKTCPAGKKWVENIDNGIDYGSCERESCPEGQIDKNGTCVPKAQCGENQEYDEENNTCHCKDGYMEINGACFVETVKTKSVSIIPETGNGIFELEEQLTPESFLERVEAKVVFNPGDADDIDTFHWSSGDDNILKISYPNKTDDDQYAGDAVFVVKNFGKTTLTISNDNVVSNKFEVILSKGEVKLTEIKLDSEDLTVTVDKSDLTKINILEEKLTLPSPTIIPEDATNAGKLTWVSSNTDILYVTTFCSGNGDYSELNFNKIQDIYMAADSSDSQAETCAGIEVPLFIPVSYGEVKVHVTNGEIDSNEITIKIEEGNETDTNGDEDGDGYLDVDDDAPLTYNVGARDLLMFATLAYDPVNSSIDRISGDTLTQNGKTVRENFYADNGEDAVVTIGENGYAEYFNYICEDRVSNSATDDNDCMYKEDRLIGMQAQEYSGLDGLIKAWQTVGKDYYFGGSENVSIKEVNQWVITDHVSQKVTISKDEGYMEATTFRLNNNIVIAYRGTDFTDLMEWFKDLTYAFGEISGYEEAAKTYAKSIFGKYADEYYADPDGYIEKYGAAPNFYITGHSLGGYLSQIGALGMIESDANGLEFLRDVIYYNGMGLDFFGDKRSNDYNTLFNWATQTDENGALLHNVICYHINGDPVSALGRHVNEVGYYASEAAVNRHATQNVSKLQSATRNKLADGFVNVFMRSVGKVGEMGILNASKIDDVKEYLDYYSEIYGENFRGKFNDDGTISILDLMWFCHEPSASLFENIKKGVNGHSTSVSTEDAKPSSRDYLKSESVTNERSNDQDEKILMDWFGESVNVTRYDEDGKVILTAQVTGDAKKYTWYNNGQEVGSGQVLVVDSEKGGSYYVDVVVNSRKSPNGKEITLSTKDSPKDIDDKTAPEVSISAEGDIWSAKTNSTVTLKITAKSPSGFKDDAIDEDDLSTSISSNIAIASIKQLDNPDDQTRIWSVTLKSSTANIFTLKVKEGAFVSNNDVASKEVKSNVITFTLFAKEEDKTGPKVTITALDGTEIEQGSELRFEIKATDESGIKENKLADKISIEPLATKLTYEFIDDAITSSDGKEITQTVSVKYDGSAKIDIAGQILVKTGAFVDNSDNSSKAEASVTFKFLAPPDRTAPVINIKSSTGNRVEYGGTIVYEVVLSDDSGLDTDSTLSTDNISVNSLSPLSIVSVTGPTYNNNQTVASYFVTITSNERCSDVLGCFGTFHIDGTAVKDVVGNHHLVDWYSPEIVFNSEIDHISPTVKITPVNGRTAEKGGTIDFNVTASDKSGISSDTNLTVDDFKIVGSKGDISVENVSKAVTKGTTTTWTVTVKGDEVSSVAYITLPAGKIKDNNGNSNILTNGDYMIFTKPRDFAAPKVKFDSASNWSVETNSSIVVQMIVTDNDELKLNQTLSENDFYILDSIKSDMKIKSVSKPEYTDDKKSAVYNITVSATKAGSGYLCVYAGTLSDVSNNKNTVLDNASQKITFTNPQAKDTKRPEVKIEPISGGWRTKAGKETKLRITVTDDVALNNPTLNTLKKYGSDDIQISVKTEKIGTKSASWIVTLTCNKNTFGWGSLVKDGTISLPIGAFKDTSGNESSLKVSNVFSFTKN